MKLPCIPSPRHYTLRDLHASEGFGHQPPMQQHLDQARERPQEDRLKALTALVTGSNADGFGTVSQYIEAGDKPINLDLRSAGPKPLATDTAELMHDLKSLNDYSGVSYRAVHVSPQGLAALRQVGGHVYDGALMSSAIAVQNVEGWLAWGADQQPGAVRHPVMLILDDTVPKKNLASSFLPDHVAVPPMVELVVRDVREEDTLTAVLLSRATPHADGATRLTDGEAHARGDLDARNERIYGSRTGYSA